MADKQKDNDKYGLTQVLDAIRGSAGIKATIMRRLTCSRNTVDNYLKRYATAMQAYNDEVELIGDVAESVIITALRNSDVDTAKWYAKVKLKNRGYVERSEISGPNGGPLETKATVNHAIDSDTATTIFDILAAVGAIPTAVDDATDEQIHTA